MAAVAVGGCEVGALVLQSKRLKAMMAGPITLHPPAGEALAVQQRLLQLGISLDPLSLLRNVLKMAAKFFARGLPLPRQGPNSERD